MAATRLELRHLRTLCVIADAGSLGQAALALDLSQPAVSKQLSRLEALIGGKLFTRSNHGVRLTPLGQDVVDEARDIIARVDVLGVRPSKTSVAVTTLRIAATHTPVLPGLVARIKAAYPDIGITVRSEYAIDALVTLLETREVDAALVLDYPGRELRESATIARRVFANESSFVALPTGHPLSRRVELALDELSGEAWFVTPSDGAGWPDVFYQACAQAGFTPAKTHEFLGDKALHGLIAEGLGITACQPTTAAVPGVLVKPLRGSPIRYRQLLAWHRQGPAHPVSADLHRFAAEAYRELASRAPHLQAWLRRRALA
ncbi:LysR family transcriptional regulator [Actinokineospora fastidiosa]|uniref:Transcriptional regulator n=1 Tax=Actinokineospora fastidiosa TaxID=1816 RepID=A0A918GQ85_9PSEU|nr:LysR family transcriptional regulator [Actinokineospora fastidiosa]GGS53959.1 transcriptional regulator [Actinokineospora fastidiosa]